MQEVLWLVVVGLGALSALYGPQVGVGEGVHCGVGCWGTMLHRGPCGTAGASCWGPSCGACRVQASFIRAILQWGGGSGWVGLQLGGWV